MKNNAELPHLLTMNHAASSYGQPVLLLFSQEPAYGPADRLPNGELASNFVASTNFPAFGYDQELVKKFCPPPAWFSKFFAKST